MGHTKTHGNTSAHERAGRLGEALEGGLVYEANEGARGGEAVRKTNCQRLESSGGAAVKTSAPRLAVNVLLAGSSSTDKTGSKSGSGSVCRTCSLLKAVRSTEQQLSSQCGLDSPEEFSEAHARNSRPGMDSSWQCSVIGSHRTAASTESHFPKRRTPDIDAGSTRNVQSSFTPSRKARCPSR